VWRLTGYSNHSVKEDFSFLFPIPFHPRLIESGFERMTEHFQIDPAEKYFFSDTPLCLRKNMSQVPIF
jgi:hypothetical protein